MLRMFRVFKMLRMLCSECLGYLKCLEYSEYSGSLPLRIRKHLGFWIDERLNLFEVMTGVITVMVTRVMTGVMI